MSVLLADTSAWHRSAHPLVRDAWYEAIVGDRIAVSDMVRLEVLCSARSAAEYAERDRDFDSVRQAPNDERVSLRAREVQRLMGERAALHHRSVKIPDLMIAASAELGGFTLWHYDEDFEHIASITGQSTLWLAARGSL